MKDFRKSITFTYNVPMGVFLSDGLTDILQRRAQEKGPVLDSYGAVILRTPFDALTADDPALRVLVYQRRWLDQKFYPRVYPQIRAAVPTDFGRSRLIAWYDPSFERVILQEGCRMAEIDPEEIL